MRVTAADLWEPVPGTLLRWDVTPTGRGVPVPLSLNQRNHLAGALAGDPTVWLAGAFDVDGPIRPEALEAAWRALVERHGSLQVEAVVQEGGVSGRRHRAGSLTWGMRDLGVTSGVEETRRRLTEMLRWGCHPFGYPAYAPLAVSRPERSTVVLGMDHLHCDAHSVAVVIDELAVLYDAFRYAGRRPRLPDAACFVSDVRDALADPVHIAEDDDRLAGWHDFLRRRESRLPTFPLDLGVAPGERTAQATVVGPLADRDVTERVGARARAAGASTCAATVAALARALGDLGGPPSLDILMPIGTRPDAGARQAVGWYTTTVPVSVTGDLSPAGLRAAGTAVRDAVRLGEVPLDRVLASLPAPPVQTRRDVFMVSWLDYRHLPGAADAAARNATHISAPTQADDLQLWVARTEGGLAVRARLPSTDAARRVVGDLLEAWGERLRSV